MPSKDVPKGRRYRGRVGLPPENLIPIGAGLHVIPSVSVDVIDDELDADATVVLVYDEDAGRYRPERLELQLGKNAPQMKEVLRRFRLQSLLDDTAIVAVRAGAWIEVEGALRPVGRGRRFAGEDELAYVARVYRIAALCGYRPNKAVEEALDVTSAAAAQKVFLARKVGLLPKTTPGKAKA